MLDSDLHTTLASFQDEVIAVLDSADFWSQEGPYNPTELYAAIPKRDIEAYQAASKEKNSRVWDLLKAALIGTAIKTGVFQVRKDYPRQVAAYEKKAESRPEKYPQPRSVKEIADAYMKEHGGEFIKNLSRADQQKLVNFIWSNRGEHERPMKAKINQQPHLRYVLDQGRHREGTIVRTEKNRATKYGSWKYATDCDFKTKTWQSTNDHRVRASHRALSGTTIPINEDFGSEGPYPGAVSINCRCHLLYGL